jgi:transposase
MNTPTKYHGVDVSKSHLDLDGLDKPHRFANTPEGCAALLAALPADAQVVCEATGGYERLLCAGAWAASRPISVVGPNLVRAFARSQGRLAKTDRLDAALLTLYATERRPAAQAAPDEAQARLRDQVRAREYVLRLQREEQNHREHLGGLPLLLEQSEARLALLAAQLAALEEAIQAEVAKAKALSERAERVQQLKGIGPVTAWTICADLPELGKLERGQAAALCGLAPYARDSGTCTGRRFIRHGRATLRRVLYMAAVTASIHNPILRAFYQGLKKRGKPAKLALIAVARRLIELLNLMLKNPDFKLAS